MRKVITVAVLLIVPLVLLGVVGASQAQLVLYDDFNSGDIDPVKWWGGEDSGGALGPNTEAVREIVNGQLELDLTNWGKTTSSAGTNGSVQEWLAFTNPVPITTIQADVTVKEATVVGCAANASTSAARAQIIGSFFNDGSSGGAGNRTGDILAGMQSQRSSGTGDTIVAFITRCTTANCSSTAVPPGGAVTFTGSWVAGVPNTLNVQWDKPNHQFIFTLNPGLSQEQHILGYAFSDSAAPILDFKHLQNSNQAANCLAPAPRGTATMESLYDNVKTN